MVVTDGPETPPFGRPLDRVGRGLDQADWLVAPAVGVLVGVYFAFKTTLLIGFLVGAAVGLVMLLLTALHGGRDRRRGDSGGDAGGEFDPSSTRHFDACHSDGGGGGGDGGDGGGDGGGD